MNLLLIFTILAYVAFPSVLANKKWAVLVATTKNWLYYRHQSSVMHAYQTLIANGFKKNNIITMFYDDIADNVKNTEKGVVRNHPEGPNVYSGMKKDYTGNKVTADNFLAVLTGDEKTAKGPVVKSSAKDNIFIYIVGLGGIQYLTFPTGPGITAQKFVDTLKKLRSDRKARKIYVNLEVSYGASIVAGLIPKDDFIFVSSATYFEEIPPAVYCYRQRKICYGSLYGSAWTQTSDRLRELKFGRKETLFDQYNKIRTLTVYSHVSIFGHLDMGRTPLRDFLGYKLKRKQKQSSSQQNSQIISQLGQAALDDLEQKMDEDKDNEEYMEQYEALDSFFGADDDNTNEENLKSDLNEMKNSGSILHSLDVLPEFADADGETSQNKADILKKRDFVTNTMKAIVNTLNEYGYNINYDNLKSVKSLTSDEAEVYHEAIVQFDSICFNINENTYSHIELSKLAKFAEMNVKLEDQIKAMKNVCTSEHRQARSIH